MKKFKILVVDNQESNRSKLKEALLANEFEVQTAANGNEALVLLKEETVDLVFIEIGKAKREGLSACQSIKSGRDWGDTPVIFMVELSDLVLINDIYESGGDDYILKPLVLSELLMKTKIHLELKYSRQIAKNMNQMLESKVSQRTQELEDSLKKLSQAKKELEILEIAKLEFLNLISHEIRTPLNGILGSLALIDRYNLPDEVNRYFSLLDLSVKRLELFSNTILEASTLRIKGAKALRFMETDLIKIIRDSLDHCTEKFKAKGIKVDLQNNTTNSILKGDHQYLLKCFNAVLDNAFKFSPKGDQVEIRVVNRPDGFLSTVISDRGNGFSKGSLDNIYKALGNLEAHFDQNTGMGLHLAKLIVDAHSGFIKVGNHNSTGAVVEIELPSNR